MQSLLHWLRGRDSLRRENEQLRKRVSNLEHCLQSCRTAFKHFESEFRSKAKLSDAETKYYNEDISYIGRWIIYIDTALSRNVQAAQPKVIMTDGWSKPATMVGASPPENQKAGSLENNH